MEADQQYFVKRAILLVLVVIAAGYLVLQFSGQPDLSDKNPRPAPTPPADQPRKADLRLLLWEGYSPPAHVARFEKDMTAKYGRPIKLSIVYAESADFIYDAIRAGTCDLATISHHTIKDQRFDFIAKRLILPFDLKNIPNHKTVIRDLQMASYHVAEGRVYGIPVANGPYGLAYCQDRVKEVPTSWNILWDKAYKGRYVIGREEYLYNVNITALAMGYKRDQISNYETLNNPEFKARLRALAENAERFWIGVDKPRHLKGMSLATSWGDSLSALRRQGENWQMAAPKEGTPWWVDEYVMTHAAGGRPAVRELAEEWINRSLTTDFQVNHLTREVQIYPVIGGIQHLLTEEEKKRIKPTEALGDFEATHILQSTHSERDRNGLQALWEEACKKAKEENGN